MTDVAAQSSNVASATPDTMAWDSRARRVVMIYLPLACFILILLFPFYWMAVTSFKPNAELLNYKEHNPFWITSPTLAHIKHLLFDTAYPRWLKTTMLVAIGSTFLSLFASTLAAYAIERLRFRGSPYVGLGIYLAYLVPPSILFIPLATVIVQFGLFDSPLALILVYPTFLVPFCTWLLIGYFKSIPYELEECALVDGATRLQILWRITLPLAVPRPDLGRHLLLHAVLERVHLRARLHPERRQQDGAGRDPDRARHRRRLPVGRADGRLAARLAAGRAVLLAVRRLLRVVADGGGEGVTELPAY
ncbi:multiple sugar transport system permease protein [Bradyrhizobium sp. USDA 4524]